MQRNKRTICNCAQAKSTHATSCTYTKYHELHELKIKSGLGPGISESGGRGEVMVSLSTAFNEISKIFCFKILK